MPVVITGAAGFIGRALVAELVEHGEQVIAIDRRPVPGGPGDLPGVTSIQADLLWLGTPAGHHVEAALREADAVFHLAGRPGVRDSDPCRDLRRYQDNVLATRRVLDTVPLPTPLVVTSSSSVYGGARGRASREGDPLRPLGGYARSKAAVERLCTRRLASAGAVAVARPFTVIGEGQRPDMALARWIEALRTGQPIRILGSTSRTRDVTDVRDVARSLRLMAERDVTGPLNVGTGHPHSLAELAGAVFRAARLTGQLLVCPVGSNEPPATRADPRRHQRLLGFRPHTDLDAVVRRQYEATTAAVPVVTGAP